MGPHDAQGPWRDTRAPSSRRCALRPTNPSRDDRACPSLPFGCRFSLRRAGTSATTCATRWGRWARACTSACRSSTPTACSSDGARGAAADFRTAALTSEGSVSGCRTQYLETSRRAAHAPPSTAPSPQGRGAEGGGPLVQPAQGRGHGGEPRALPRVQGGVHGPLHGELRRGFLRGFQRSRALHGAGARRSGARA